MEKTYVSLPFLTPIIPNREMEEKFPLGRLAEKVWTIGEQRTVTIIRTAETSNRVIVKPSIHVKQHFMASALKVAALILFFPFFLGLKLIYRWKNNVLIEEIQLAKMAQKKVEASKKQEESPLESENNNTLNNNNSTTATTENTGGTLPTDQTVSIQDGGQQASANNLVEEDLADEIEEEGSEEEGVEEGDGGEEEDLPEAKVEPVNVSANPDPTIVPSNNQQTSNNTPLETAKPSTAQNAESVKQSSTETVQNPSSKAVTKPPEKKVIKAQPSKPYNPKPTNPNNNNLKGPQIPRVTRLTPNSPSTERKAAENVNQTTTLATKQSKKEDKKKEQGKVQEPATKSSIKKASLVTPKNSSDVSKQENGGTVPVGAPTKKATPPKTQKAESMPTVEKAKDVVIVAPKETPQSLVEQQQPKNPVNESTATIEIPKIIPSETQAEQLAQKIDEANINPNNKKENPTKNKRSTITVDFADAVARERKRQDLMTKGEEYLNKAKENKEDYNFTEQADSNNPVLASIEDKMQILASIENKMRKNYQAAFVIFSEVVSSFVIGKKDELENLEKEFQMDEDAKIAMEKALDCLLEFSTSVTKKSLAQLGGRERYNFFRRQLNEYKENYQETDIAKVQNKLKRFGKLSLSVPPIKITPIDFDPKDITLNNNKLVEKVKDITIHNAQSGFLTPYAYSVSSTAGKPNMEIDESEDRYLIKSFKVKQENSDIDVDVTLFAIFDGEAGASKETFCSEKAKNKLDEALKFKLENKNSLSILDIWNALKTSLLTLDARISDSSGISNVCYAIVFKDPITKKDVAWTANLGTSRAILGMGSTCIQLSTDAVIHDKDKDPNVHDKKFHDAIEIRNGMITKDHNDIFKLNDNYQTLRYINGKSIPEKGLSKRPELMEIQITELVDQGNEAIKLFMFTKGTTEVLGSQEAIDITKKLDIAESANKLVYEGLRRKSSDNNTVMAIELKKAKKT